MASIPKTLGKYQVLGAIGRGGMGEVYKAYQADLHRHVAIKTLLAGEHATEEFLQRFQREARVAAKLVHPNIVQIHDIGTEGKLHYIVMEYVEGRSLRQILSEKKLDVETSLKIAHSIARTLKFAHEHQIVHRDIKPANILIDRQGRVRILDFGLAKSLADGKALTLSSVMVGTPYYMSPEQAFAAPDEVDARTDLYSLGAVLYELLTGRPPFEGGTVLAILRKIEEEEPAPPGISPAVDAVVMKALAKDRDRRFQTAGDAAEAIKGCLSGAAADSSAGASAAGRLSQTLVRAVLRVPPPVLWPAAAGLAALVIVLGLWLIWPWEAPAPSAPSPPAALPAPPDPATELRALLERKKDVTPEDLARFREDPPLRRLIAEHFLKRGQFSRAVEYLKGYERAICELASAQGLLRFFSPALFKLSIPRPRDLQGRPETFMMEALARHLEGKQDAARQRLKWAENNCMLPSHVLLVRAHIDLWDVWPDPGGENQKQVLAALRRDLEKSNELYILPLRAVAAQLDGDGASAREIANRLGRYAGRAAETATLSAILCLRAGRVDLAMDEISVAATMADPKTVDFSIPHAYLRLLEVLNDPAKETLEVDPDSEKMDIKEMKEALDERLRHDHFPAALFLRTVVNALDAKWEAAEEDLRKMVRRAPLERITVDHERLTAFFTQGLSGSWAGNSRSRLLEATSDLLSHLGRGEAALATAEKITGEDLPEEERGEFLLQNHLRIARYGAADEAKALKHVEEALKLGALPANLAKPEANLGALPQKPAFQELLKAYRGNHVQMAKALLGEEKVDENAVRENLEEALKLGVTPQELRDNAELGQFRKKPVFEQLVKKYEN